VDQHKGLFLTPTPEETALVAKIFQVKHFQALIGEKQRLKGQPVADPFVVAMAKARRGTAVTQERWKENAAKIPNVCKHLDVPCLSLEGFLSERGWSF